MLQTRLTSYLSYTRHAEDVWQKFALHKCNMAGKPAAVTCVVDSMTDNLRPTRADATDVANAVLDVMPFSLVPRLSVGCIQLGFKR
ncbi:unnamed protein product [Triticum turgidum subsp. durum]|uniref:pyruvate kinase n=1 Tax=Triticum turgidum subsp. durum TaxID=4567 RepID=A0A9R0VRH8_TRITD|nr:unnamed protein product [Triticum turgidum subsp. durum]